jgi:hypothetical protein
MQRIRIAVRYFSLGVIASCGLAMAQGPNASSGDTGVTSGRGWPRAIEAPAVNEAAPAQVADQVYPRIPDAQHVNSSFPSQLTVRPGTFITVRLSQPLSSDHNQPGDAFSATLVSPLVVDGLVVAQRGQMVAGRVAEAQKAGRVEGVSRLGIELTELTLVDGQQVPLRTQLITRNGPTSEGRDAGAIAATTATGAAIGAAAGWGTGAAIGAGAGAAAGVIGVLLTRGHPTILYPESMLTFRIEAPITFSTDRTAQAFRYVTPDDYQQQQYTQVQPGPYAAAPPPAPAPAPYYYGGYYGPSWYAPYPYYWGPSFSFFYGYGPRYYRPYYYGGGFYRGGVYVGHATVHHR